MNDSRWPWVILVPAREGLTELHDLAGADRQTLVDEIASASAIMRSVTRCRSVNVAALGNVVAQLHVHVVARDEGDPNWPRPVWGHGESEPYADGELPAFASAIRDALSIGG